MNSSSYSPANQGRVLRGWSLQFGIFQGLTFHAIIGRRVFDTRIKVLDLAAAGVKVADLVTDEFEGLDDFHEAMRLRENRQAMKMVFF